MTYDKKPIQIGWAFANILPPQMEAFPHVPRRLILVIIELAL
jgi:hypothetical protein